MVFVLAVFIFIIWCLLKSASRVEDAEAILKAQIAEDRKEMRI
jgi:hypothetical protein